MLHIQILPPDDTSLLPELQTMWQSICTNIGLEKHSKTLLIYIKNNYSESHRAYHNLSHIYTLLKITEQYKSEIENEHMLELAIWYHDIIYRATRKDNEVKSAEYALDVLLESIVPSLELEYLKSLIVSTKKHEYLIDNFDNRFLLDIDLGVLAASRDTYTQYASAIREEYRIYTNFLYKKGRRKVLKHFLEREWIYFTNAFRDLHESDARANLEWEIENL